MSSDRVSETAPVQVYLDRGSRERLDRLAASMSMTMSEVLRRGLLALEREVTDPASHPALKLLGTASQGTGTMYDVAREHDRFLAMVHESEPPTYENRAKSRKPRSRG
jgi:hypothetical protein